MLVVTKLAVNDHLITLSVQNIDGVLIANLVCQFVHVRTTLTIFI